MGEANPKAAGQNTIDALDVGFVPTVCGHTRYSDGYRLHTIDPDEDRDIEIFDDDRPPRFVGEGEQAE